LISVVIRALSASALQASFMNLINRFVTNELLKENLFGKFSSAFNVDARKRKQLKAGRINDAKDAADTGVAIGLTIEVEHRDRIVR